MAMLVVYHKIPADEIRADAAKAIVQIGEWFKTNPKRRVCNAQIWYGKTAKIRRKTVAEDITKAMNEAIG